MRELRFDGLSPDGTHLILAGKDGQRWSVVIDERIVAAIRRDRARLSQVELEQSGGLRPREIQARIRAGATAEDVAAASGLPVEHVRRFEGPVLTERAWVAQQARATEVRRPGGDVEVGELVGERLQDQGVDPDDITWDAWRREDGLWVVIATFPIPPNTLVATWTYDSSSRTMTVVDDNARVLSAITLDGPLRLVTHARPTLAAVAPLAPTRDTRESAPPENRRDIPRSREDDEAEEGAAQAADDDQADDAAGGGDDDAAVPAEQAHEDATHDVPPTVPAPSAGHEDPVDPDPDDRDPTDSDSGDPSPAAAEPTTDPAGAEDEPAQAAESATPADDGDPQLFDAPAPAAAPRGSGRPSVPSFDDILFGPGRKK